MSCHWCDEGNTRVVSSIDPEGKTFVHHTSVGRVVCGETPITKKPRTEIIYCPWCKKIIVELAVPDSVVTLFPEFHRAYINGVPTLIGDGMCEHCRTTKFSEFPKKVVTNDLATK